MEVIAIKRTDVGTKAFLKRSGIQVYWLVLVNFLATGIRIRIQKAKSMRIHVDPDPHHCFSTFLISIQLPQMIEFSS
jgi:hypothetical protein